MKFHSILFLSICLFDILLCESSPVISGIPTGSTHPRRQIQRQHASRNLLQAPTPSTTTPPTQTTQRRPRLQRQPASRNLLQKPTPTTSSRFATTMKNKMGEPSETKPDTFELASKKDRESRTEGGGPVSNQKSRTQGGKSSGAENPENGIRTTPRRIQRKDTVFEQNGLSLLEEENANARAMSSKKPLMK